MATRRVSAESRKVPGADFISTGRGTMLDAGTVEFSARTHGTAASNATIQTEASVRLAIVLRLASAFCRRDHDVSKHKACDRRCMETIPLLCGESKQGSCRHARQLSRRAPASAPRTSPWLKLTAMIRPMLNGVRMAAVLLGLAALESTACAETILFVGNSFTFGAGRASVQSFRPDTREGSQSRGHRRCAGIVQVLHPARRDSPTTSVSKLPAA